MCGRGGGEDLLGSQRIINREISRKRSYILSDLLKYLRKLIYSYKYNNNNFIKQFAFHVIIFSLVFSEIDELVIYA